MAEHLHPDASIRRLAVTELHLVWTINRSETISTLYRQNKTQLLPEPADIHLQGWPAGEPAHYGPFLAQALDQGGSAWGAWHQGVLVGATVLGGQSMGSADDQLQLLFLHVSQQSRKTGLGRQLFATAAQEAQRRGARSLYISATPSGNTVHFYLHLGCQVLDVPDPEMFQREPEDIHLEYLLGTPRAKPHP